MKMDLETSSLLQPTPNVHVRIKKISMPALFTYPDCAYCERVEQRKRGESESCIVEVQVDAVEQALLGDAVECPIVFVNSLN